MFFEKDVFLLRLKEKMNLFGSPLVRNILSNRTKSGLFLFY